MEGRVRRGGLEMSLMLARQRAAKAGNGEGETVVSPSVIASGKAGLLAANQTAALVSASLAEDLEALHSIASFERKAVFKRDTLLPKYAEYINRSVTPDRRTTCWAMPLSGCSTAGSSSAPLILLAGAWSTGSGFPTVSSRPCPCSSRSGRSNGPRRNTMPGRSPGTFFSGRCSIVWFDPDPELVWDVPDQLAANYLSCAGWRWRSPWTFPEPSPY